MDFANDEEIAELLNLSTNVIKEIQKSELKPPQTTGRPPVSQGNTRNLTDLWEKETASQTKAPAQSTQTIQVQSDENEEGEIKSESIDGHIRGTVNQSEQVPEQNQSRSSPGDDLDRALNKLEGRINLISSMDKEIKKGPRIQNLPGSQAATQQATHPLAGDTPNMQAQTKALAKPHQEAINLGNQDTGESIHSPPSMAPPESLVGAIRNAPQFVPDQSMTNVDAGSVQLHASCAEMISRMFVEVISKLDKLESRLNDIAKVVNTTPLIRNDINQLKATTALMSNQIASIQILDPGNAGVRSLSEMKSVTKKAAVVIAGFGDDPTQIIEEGIMAKDALGKPVPPTSVISAKAQTSSSVSKGEIEGLIALVETLVDNDKKAAKLIKMIDQVKSHADYARVKQAIYNA
nr:phosphoprotein [Avian metaavulavirus 8]